MKFAKPTYDASKKVYGSDIHEGPRYTAHTSDGFEKLQASVSLSLGPSFTQTIVESTKSWFSKPLTAEWLSTRIRHTLQQPVSEFEGNCIWEAQTLTISKEVFLFQWGLISQVPDAKVIIDFEEEGQDGEDLRDAQEIPTEETAAEPLHVGPTRRMLHKREVLRMRDRAARCLFKAERMTQEYCGLYGEDTDWEEDDLDSEDSD